MTAAALPAVLSPQADRARRAALLRRLRGVKLRNWPELDDTARYMLTLAERAAGLRPPQA